MSVVAKTCVGLVCTLVAAGCVPVEAVTTPDSVDWVAVFEDPSAVSARLQQVPTGGLSLADDALVLGYSNDQLLQDGHEEWMLDGLMVELQTIGWEPQLSKPVWSHAPVGVKVPPLTSSWLRFEIADGVIDATSLSEERIRLPPPPTLFTGVTDAGTLLIANFGDIFELSEDGLSRLGESPVPLTRLTRWDGTYWAVGDGRVWRGSSVETLTPVTLADSRLVGEFVYRPAYGLAFIDGFGRRIRVHDNLSFVDYLPPANATASTLSIAVGRAGEVVASGGGWGWRWTGANLENHGQLPIPFGWVGSRWVNAQRPARVVDLFSNEPLGGLGSGIISVDHIAPYGRGAFIGWHRRLYWVDQDFRALELIATFDTAMEDLVVVNGKIFVFRYGGDEVVVLSRTR